VKRLAARSSLQRTVDNQILTPKDLYDFAKENVKGIQVMWVSSDEIEEVTAAKLEERYKLAKTIEGTQSFHKFIPIPGTRQVRCKHVSSAETEVIKTCSL
jgi:hypothetical protein